MGCVIDHLQRDQRVRVLREFTDLRRTRVRAGVEGVIREMDVDWIRNEIWIDWEREGSIQRLVFDLRGKEGPGNGRMKAFFEARESVLPPSRPEVHAEGISRFGDNGPSVKHRSPGAPLVSGPITPGTSLGERTVACACDPAFHRSLVPASELCVSACLRCGTLSVTQRVGDDGRFSGEPVTDHLVVEISNPVARWLTRWPRVKIDYAGAPNRWPMAGEWVRYPTLYYPADLRCDSIEELSRTEGLLLQAQARSSRVPPLRRAGWPQVPPPLGMPSSLRGFVQLWESLQLDEQTDLETLIYLAQLRSPASAVAAELLLRRQDCLQVLRQALRSDDAVWRSAGMAMAREFEGDAARLTEMILEVLSRASLEPSSEVPERVSGWQVIESMLVVIGDRKLNSSDVVLALLTLQRRLARVDPSTSAAIGIILRELKSSSPG